MFEWPAQYYSYHLGDSVRMPRSSSAVDSRLSAQAHVQYPQVSSVPYIYAIRSNRRIQI